MFSGGGAQSSSVEDQGICGVPFALGAQVVPPTP